MSAPADRARLVEAARVSIVRGSKSFAAASRLFDARTRERAWLLYAWCRAGDDSTDGQEGGHGMALPSDAPQRVAALRTKTEAALAGKATGEAAFDGLALVVAETAMPPAWPLALIDGFALDAAEWRPQTEADLLTYCWHVAGVVGCMMATVMGVAPTDDATLDRAADLGLAFQLANIARDLGEDAEAGRCYLPADWLAEEGLTAATVLSDRAALARLARRLTMRAAAFEASSRVGTAALSYRSAWAVLAAADIYGAIGREVARRGAAAWDGRVTTSRAAKLGFIARAAIAAARRGRHAADPPPRPDWQRPRGPVA